MRRKTEIEWIAPSDELPNEFETVIVLHRSIQDSFCCTFSQGMFRELSWKFVPDEISLWARLPKREEVMR